MIEAPDLEVNLLGIMKAIERLNYFMDLRDPDDQPIASAPASASELEELAQERKHAIPPTYKQLLELHNGIHQFYMVNGNLLSSTYIVSHPHYADMWEQNDMFFIVTDDDWNAVAFDTRTTDDNGEMEIQEYHQNCASRRFPSLCAFLTAYRSRLEDAVENALADRRRLDD